MLHFLAEYGLFLAKSITIIAGILILVAGVVALSHRKGRESEGHIEVKDLGARFDEFEEDIKYATLFEDQLKAEHKEQRKKEKAEEKARKKHKEKPEDIKKRIFVLDFDGDVKASAVENLREEISAILTIAKPGEQVLVRLESSGGMVHSYGLAASQLQRLNNGGLELIIAVDRVAASGGYMMACIGKQILAAPFAIIGSIGVMAQLPNINRLLKKHDVDIELHTAGEFKRTLTVLGENTEKGRQKFLEELEETHILFKKFVAQNRPQLNIDQVATGEVWYGSQAVENKLIDAIKTSDEFLMENRENSDLFLVSYVEKKPWQEKLGMAVDASIERVLLRWLNQLSQRFFW